MAGIFVSYRRQDSGQRAARLSEALVRAFGHEQVLIDVEALRADANYVAAIDAAADTSSVVVVLIGPMWLEAKDSRAHRLLDLPDDLVRLEIGAALARRAPVLPVLLGGAQQPMAAQLPPELAPLASLQPVVVADSTWARDIHGLLDAVAALGGLVRLDHLAARPTPASPSRFRWLVIGAALALAALVVLGRWFETPTPDGDVVAVARQAPAPAPAAPIRDH